MDRHALSRELMGGADQHVRQFLHFMITDHGYNGLDANYRNIGCGMDGLAFDAQSIGSGTGNLTLNNAKPKAQSEEDRFLLFKLAL